MWKEDMFYFYATLYSCKVECWLNTKKSKNEYFCTFLNVKFLLKYTCIFLKNTQIISFQFDESPKLSMPM